MLSLSNDEISKRPPVANSRPAASWEEKAVEWLFWPVVIACAWISACILAPIEMLFRLTGLGWRKWKEFDPQGERVGAAKGTVLAWGGRLRNQALEAIMGAPETSGSVDSAADATSPATAGTGSLAEPAPANQSPLHRLLQQTPAPGAWLQFCEGFRAPWEGFGYLRQRQWLWRFGIIPVLLNLLITAIALVVFVALAFWAVGLVEVLVPQFVQSLPIRLLVMLGFLVVAIGGALMTWLILQGILCGHFYGKLAERIERELGMPAAQICSIPLRYQVEDTLRDVAAAAVVNLWLLMLNVVPGLGSAAAFCGSAYFNSFLLGSDFFDYPLALRGMRRDQKREFCRRYRAHTVGLGAAVYVLSLIPVVGAVFLTTAVAGSVLLHRRLSSFDRTV